MISNYSERNPDLKHTKWLQEGAMVLGLEQSLCAVNRCGWFILSASFWCCYAIAFVVKICWEGCLKMRKPATVISEIVIRKSLLFAVVLFILFTLTEYLERSKVCIFLQSKRNPFPILDNEKGSMLLEVIGWQWENA